jgi:MFS family permease
MLYTPAFWALALANLSHTASFAALFLLPLYVLAHGGSQADVGLIMGAFALASAVFRPWISEMIDRIGRKRSYTIGTLIMFIIPLVQLLFTAPLGSSYPLFLLLRIIHGIGMAICFTAVFTFVADLMPQNRLNEGIGIFGISGLLGVALGPLLAEAIQARLGFNGLFLTASGLALIALLTHLPLKESFQRASTPGPSFFNLLKQGKFLIVCLLSALFGIGIAATSNFVSPLAGQRGLGLISAFYVSYSIGAIATRLTGGRLADRYGENRILPFGIVFYAAGLFLLPFTYSVNMLILAGAFTGIGHGLIFPSLNTLAVRNEPAEIRGKATGIFTGGIDTGAFAGSLILGYIGQWLGLNSLFLFAAVTMTAGLFLFGFRHRGKPSLL